MKIYLLSGTGPRPMYDSYDSHVAIAASPKAARELAASNRGDEGPDYWRDPERSRCVVIGTTERQLPKLVCSSFNAG